MPTVPFKGRNVELGGSAKREFHTVLTKKPRTDPCNALKQLFPHSLGHFMAFFLKSTQLSRGRFDRHHYLQPCHILSYSPFCPIPEKQTELGRWTLPAHPAATLAQVLPPWVLELVQAGLDLSSGRWRVTCWYREQRQKQWFSLHISVLFHNHKLSGCVKMPALKKTSCFA